MIREPLAPARPVSPIPGRKGTRRWRHWFRDAVRGLKLGLRGNSSFAVHYFCAAVAVAACLALQCRLWEWCLILVCVGTVFTAEMINSAIETLYHGLAPDVRPASKASLDIAAGAVLTAGLVAGLVGLIVFVNRLGELMRWWNDQ
jgi:diacylglycerol kinase